MPILRFTHQATGLFILFDVDPFERHAVTHKKVACLVGLRREAATYNSQAPNRWTRARPPIGQEIVDYWIQVLFRWLARLDQEIVNPRLFDRLNRVFSVAKCREQYALGVRKKAMRLTEKLDSGHIR